MIHDGMSRLLVTLLLVIFGNQVYSQVLFEEGQANLPTEEVVYGTINTFHGPGLSFADYNNDGWDDISIPSSDTQDFQFLRNTGGQFVVDELPISSEGQRARQVCWVDFDNDGDLDFFATSDLGRCWFYRNEGNNAFTDILTVSGIATSPRAYWGVAWGDYNNDGWLDAFLMVRDPSQVDYNLLYENRGNGLFNNVTIQAGLDTEGYLTQSAVFIDYNRDGFQDIFIANDKDGIPNKLYRNLGTGQFQDVSIASDMDLNMDGMSATVEDYNYDGLPDIYVTNIFPPDISGSVVGNAFLENNGDGTFSNIALANGTRFDSFGWGAVFLDAENDGDLDLYVSSQLDGTDGRIPSAFYLNDGTGNYAIPQGIGFSNDNMASYGNAIGDIQNDGLPDIAVVNIDDQPIDLWVNNTINPGNWLKVKLEGTESNRMGVGSVIEIGAEGNVYYRYTFCGEGFISQNSSYEFFGLEFAGMADYIEVSWPSGNTDRIENIMVNQALTIVEGSNPVESGGNGEGGGSEEEEESDHSVARRWNEALLDAIREDLARPTVHARNLFHSAIAMYDSWALFDPVAEPVFLGKSFGGFTCSFQGIQQPDEIDEAREEIMSYALLRLLSHRFANSPGASFSLPNFSSLFEALGYNASFTETDYSQGSK